MIPQKYSNITLPISKQLVEDFIPTYFKDSKNFTDYKSHNFKEPVVYAQFG